MLAGISGTCVHGQIMLVALTADISTATKISRLFASAMMVFYWCKLQLFQLGRVLGCVGVGAQSTFRASHAWAATFRTKCNSNAVGAADQAHTSAVRIAEMSTHTGCLRKVGKYMR